MFDIPFKSVEYLLGKVLPFLDYIRTFMPIHIHPLFRLLALIPKFESEPSLGGRLYDCGLDSKSR